jgi:ABC-type amino acid transport substrate-binding protein
MRMLAISVVVLALAGCGVPVDPDGTLDRVTGGVLRVGASPSGELVQVDGGEVSGSLVELTEGFAATRDARVEWRVDGEEDLVDELASGELDLAIGGMTAATPWVDRVSVTRAYPQVPGSRGADVVVLLPLGENALQSALERYLDRELG